MLHLEKALLHIVGTHKKNNKITKDIFRHIVKLLLLFTYMPIILLENDISPEHEFCKYDLVGDKKKIFFLPITRFMVETSTTKNSLTKEKYTHLFNR